MRTEAWLTYLAIEWRAAGMDPAAYWQDLCELRLWELGWPRTPQERGTTP